MVTLARRAARTPLGPVIAVMFGLVAAIIVAATPGWLFERGVVASGLPSILSFAEPPLGLTARLLAVGFAFLGVAGVIWAVWTLATRLTRPAPAMWHDAGYDAPVPEAAAPARRRPILAPEELGAPLMSDAAIAPRETVEAEVPGAEAEPEYEPLPAVARHPLDNSISGLIARLEAGLARRASNDDDDPEGGAALSLSSSWIVEDAPDLPEYPANDDRVQSAMRKLSWS